MKAMVYEKGRAMLQERAYPALLEETDVVVRVTLSSICTSDLHILHGAVPRAREGVALGHEFVGVVESVGAGVRALRPGMRVAANCITFCGECWFCRHGYINNCERGGWELGCRIDGCQAEAVRVPLADRSLTPIPDAVTDKQALLTGDVLSSGYFGAELAQIKPGDAVAVIGAGPVGLCAMACARLFGAGRIIALELDARRRAFALERGYADEALEPGKAALERVLSLSHGRGADAVIEAAGSAASFEQAWRVARPNAVVAVVAMYEAPLSLPLPEMYGKNLIFKTGGVDAVHCARLLDLMASGRLDVTDLLTHETDLAHIEEAYRRFAARGEFCLKWAISQ